MSEYAEPPGQYQESINVKYERVEDAGEKTGNGGGGGGGGAGQQQDTTYVTLETVQSMNHGPHGGYQQMSSYNEDSPPPYTEVQLRQPPYMTYRGEASPNTEIPYTVSYAEQKDVDSPGGASVVYMKSDPTLTTTTGGSHAKAIGYNNTVLQGHYEGHNASPTQQVRKY